MPIIVQYLQNKRHIVDIRIRIIFKLLRYQKLSLRLKSNMYLTGDKNK